MSSPSDPKDPPAEDAEGQRARLGIQAEAIHAVLVRLLQDAVQAESLLERGQAAGLAEVNEQLVVAAMVNDARAEAAGHALERAAESAALDALTGLPNRATFLDRFQLAVAHSRRHGLRLALLFVDLDDFKRINDTCGHAFGDRVLRLVAERMSAVVRGVDTVSRHGGDEFLILLTELSEPGDARAPAENLVAAVGAPFELDGRTTSVAASVGISIYPDDGEDADTLIAHADAAMYEAKRSAPAASRSTEARVGRGARVRAPPANPPAAERARRARSAGRRVCARPTRSWCWPRSPRRNCRRLQSRRSSGRRRSWQRWRTNCAIPSRPSASRAAMLGGRRPTSRCCRGCRALSSSR